MAWPDSDYPGGIDAPPDPPATLDGIPLHDELHLFVHDAVEKLEQTLGTNPHDGYTDVRTRLRAMGLTVGFNYTPGSTLEGAGATWTDWFTIGNIAVPTWATSAIVDMRVVGAFASTPSAATYLLRSVIATTTTATPGGALYLDKASTARDSVDWVDVIPSPPTGTQTLKVQANRSAGTGVVCRVDTSSRISGTVTFKG